MSFELIVESLTVRHDYSCVEDRPKGFLRAGGAFASRYLCQPLMRPSGIGIYTTLVRRWTCGEEACSRDDRIADAVLTDAPRSKCGSWLACEDGLTGNTVGPGTYPLFR